MPALNRSMIGRSGDSHLDRKAPLLPLAHSWDDNDEAGKRKADERLQPQHRQQQQPQPTEQLTNSPSRACCMGQCQTLFSLQHEEDDDDNIDDSTPINADTATMDEEIQTNRCYHDAAEWPLQHLAIFEQLETEYDRALQEIKLDLKAKLHWIRYSAGYSVIFVIAYLLIGVVFFRQVTDWTLTEAIFFAVYTMTSAGYGCYKMPRTNVFQLFQIVYILVGIAALAIMVAQVFQYLAFETSLAQQAMDKPELARRGLDLLSNPTANGQISEDRRSTLQSTINVHRQHVPRAVLHLFQIWNQAKTFFRTDPTGKVLFVVIPLLFILLSGGLVVGAIEQWTLMESIYFAVVSMTTVGYGDYFPTQNSSTWVTAIWLPWSIVFLSIYMGSVASWYLDMSNRTMKRIESAMRVEIEKQIPPPPTPPRESLRKSGSTPGQRAENPKETGLSRPTSPAISEASSNDDLAIVPSSELFGAPGTEGGPGTVRRERILQLKTVAQLNPWTHEGQAMSTMADVLLTTHARLEALAWQREAAAAGGSDELKQRTLGPPPEFIVLRTNSSTSEYSSNTSRPPLELRLLVLERLAAIIANDVTGISSSIEIQQDTLSITLNNLKHIAQKWLVPRRALKVFRSVAFECLYFIGEHALITRGVAALFELSPMEFHKLFHPLLAAMGDAETLETWLASTEIMASQHLPNARAAVDGSNSSTPNPTYQSKRTHQKFTVNDKIANLPLPFHTTLR